MEKATWEEIKALASDFKRTQAVTLNQKLTERNCIDIINYLCSTKQLTLYFTTDGKTFLTPQELEKEIYEELEVSNDRIELTKLCASLDLDSHTIDSVVNKMINNDENLQIVMGNLVNSSYIRRVALKINEIIKEKGKITILELTQVFNLPKVFVEMLINNNLTSIIEAHKDGDMLYTNNFIRRHTGIIRGYLTRSAKPVTISNLNHKFSISEKLIVRIISELIDGKRIVGKFDQNKSVFVPDIHLKHQKLYLRQFFEQNNYLDFTTVKEIGIQNASKYIEAEFPEMTVLSSCALGDGIISQLEVAIQDCDKNDGYVDCYQTVPLVVNLSDLQTLMDKFIEDTDKLIAMGDGYIVSRGFIAKCVSFFDSAINSRAEEFVAKNSRKSLGTIFTESSFVESVEEETPSKGGEKIVKIKYGGGQRGREVKAKAVKNKYMSDKKSTNKKPAKDGGAISLEFLSEHEALAILTKNLAIDDLPESLLLEIFQLIEKQLSSKYKAQCQLAMLQTSDTAKNRADHQRFESVIAGIINKIRIFEKAFLEIDVESLRSDLRRYCRKTLGNELVNCLFEHVAKETEFPWDPAVTVTNDLKTKLIGHVGRPELAAAMKSVNKSLKEATAATHTETEEQSLWDQFNASCDSMCALLGIMGRKPLDKKTEKSLIQEMGAHYQSIVASQCDTDDAGRHTIDPGEVLLVAVVLLFQKMFGLPLHASGRFVPAIIEFLRSKSTGGGGIDWNALKQYEQYVVATIRMQQSAAPDEVDAFRQAHEQLHSSIVDIALNWKSLKNL